MNEPISIDGAEHVHDLLSEYLNGDLDDAQRQAIRAHLEACAACRRDYESLRLTVQLVHQVPLRVAPRSFAIPAPPPRQRRSLTWLRISTGALAAIFVAVLALQLVLPATVRPTTSSSSTAGTTFRTSGADTAARPAAPAATPRQAVPALAAAQARSVPEAAGPAPTAAASAPMADGAQAPAPAMAKSASASTQGEASAADTTVASEPSTTLARAATPLPQPTAHEPVAPTPAGPVVPDWYLPLLIAVGALLVVSLSGLIWVTARR